jgi:anthranilate phosphoribosyltransferase
MIKEATAKLINHKMITYEEAKEVMNEIMSGKASPVQTAAYLTTLATAGESIDVITASAEEMRAHAKKVDHGYEDIFEIVGTGGDNAKSFNISTTASIVIAAAGIKVAKHGNRAASSNSGSADCLEALGFKIDLSPEECVMQLRETGFCFMFAQKFHTSMKYVAPVRKELGLRTIFNILGPLTNPAAAKIQLLGVYSEHLVEPLAHVLSNLGIHRGLVVYGQDQLDEISLSAPTTICEFNNETFQNYMIRPEDFGLKTCDKAELVGGSPAENAKITKDILQGVKGPKRDAVLMNAGAGLYLTGKAESIMEGITLAAQLIDSGKAKEKLNEIIDFSQKAGENVDS